MSWLSRKAAPSSKIIKQQTLPEASQAQEPDDLVRAYVSIVFVNCFMIREIRVIKGPTGLFVSFPAKKQIDGTHWDIAFPANTETRMMIQQVILAEYEKIVGKADPVPIANAK